MPYCQYGFKLFACSSNNNRWMYLIFRFYVALCHFYAFTFFVFTHSHTYTRAKACHINYVVSIFNSDEMANGISRQKTKQLDNFLACKPVFERTVAPLLFRRIPKKPSHRFKLIRVIRLFQSLLRLLTLNTGSMIVGNETANIKLITITAIY